MNQQQLFQKQILEEINTRKKVYKISISDMISAYNREIETGKEYNGRQLLELLQNADDEKSDEVRIELNTKKNMLIISNRGDNCNPFSYKGICSLMISNFSPKTTKKFIGNKGLGFRSIINWSEKIIINSNDFDILFSREVVNGVYDELFDANEQEKIRKEQNLSPNTSPIPYLSIPAITENIQSDWITSIKIYYKSDYFEDIKKQIVDLKSEILLFLNSIKKLVVVIDDNLILDAKKEELSKKWKIFQNREKLPTHFWDEEDKEEYYDLKIVLQDNLTNDIKELFSYFPTKIDINLPFIVHGTFELNSSRNEINDSKKNRYILERLVELIIDTAKELTKEEIGYKALEMLSYSTKNNILDSLGFYEAIGNAIKKLEVFPCLDGKYRTMDDVIFVDSLSIFVQRTHNEELFENLLIPLKEDIKLKLNDYQINVPVSIERLNELSSNIKDISDRADLIYIFYKAFKHVAKLQFLIDKDGTLISLDDDVYTPSRYDFSIPSYVKIKFIHTDLFDQLIKKFDINSNEKSRDLQRKLKDITNIQSYEPAPVLQKIVASTNIELKKDNANQISILNSTHQCNI